eukprot:COSAG01_NODE_43839_length_425_cov_3.000000_1_plen_87_part_10
MPWLRPTAASGLSAIRSGGGRRVMCCDSLLWLAGWLAGRLWLRCCAVAAGVVSNSSNSSASSQGQGSATLNTACAGAGELVIALICR